MMEGLIVWAALGPTLAFIAGVVVVAWWDDDDDEEEVSAQDLPRRAGDPGLGVPEYIPSFDLYRPGRPAGSPLSGPAVARPAGRPARSCLQCGRREGWP